MTATAKPKLDRAHVLGLLGQMIRIRKFEDACAELYTQQKIRGFLHLYDGEEAVAAGVIPVLEPRDRVVATYREHGHALVRGLPMTAVMAEMFGKAEGCSGGRGGSMHLFDAAAKFYGGNAIVGGGLPLAAGLALADRMQGRDAVTACFFGEGAVAEGEFHEAVNLAALWQLPVLFVCENNGYAMGSALERTEAETDIARKVAGYGIAGQAVDGMDVVAVEVAARRAVAAIPAPADPIADAIAEALTEAQTTPAPQAQPRSGPPMTGSERDAFMVAVSQCWNFNALSTEAAQVTVTVAMEMAPDGKPVAASMRMADYSGGTGSAAEQAYEVARRAILQCQRTGYPLPVDKYDQWRQIELVFNPERMRLR
ncbi:thiamine pyrophosphate-dependent enzyme [Mangrovicoccus ximenensis]|uniref:thiamine pyrophosphate-dependent enzyme n=1 Tax=Mangrovicoccus ximenensis TaxID=1911570 RepID=UPI000D3C3250|nr:thiamine pyrophosphate-dependent enzyme [Mangrovicoccus ximenensis]